MAYAHGYYAFPKLEGEIGPHMTFRGKKMLNWSLNNYLGLANHPEVRKADAEGAAKFGLSLIHIYPSRKFNGEIHRNYIIDRKWESVQVPLWK